MRRILRLTSPVRRRPRLIWATVGGLALVILTLYQVTFSPPFLRARPLDVAAGSVSLLVDLQKSDITSLAPSVDQMAGLATQADLLGQVMVTDPVVEDIAHRLAIPVSRIQADAPVTSDVPRTVIEPNSGSNAMSLLTSPDRFQLQVQVDPTTPVIHVYTQAPSGPMAVRFATAAVHALDDYVARLSGTTGVGAPNRIRIVQLGPATGGALQGSASKQIALLAFATGFAGTLFALALIRRVRTGWRLQAPGLEA
jgi:hypothetical protein